MSAAGARSQLASAPTIELVGPADIDRARVALVVGDAVDEGATRVVRAIKRDGIPRVVLVASRFEETGVVSAVAAGVTGFLRRSEANTSRLADVLRQADTAGCQLPEGLLRRAGASAAAQTAPSTGVPTGPSGAEKVPLPDIQVGRQGGAPSAVATVRLSARETDVVRLLAEGYDTGDIAAQVGYSESTIKGILARVMSRTEARNRCHLVALAIREALI